MYAMLNDLLQRSPEKCLVLGVMIFTVAHSIFIGGKRNFLARTIADELITKAYNIFITAVFYIWEQRRHKHTL